ncbi:hypothetical protein SD53_06690 [Rheinheimera mesophila]|nr:hypothetical protein SD53_06690 [Rheinheimera mesophila]
MLLSDRGFAQVKQFAVKPTEFRVLIGDIRTQSAPKVAPRFRGVFISGDKVVLLFWALCPFFISGGLFD